MGRGGQRAQVLWRAGNRLEEQVRYSPGVRWSVKSAERVSVVTVRGEGRAHNGPRREGEGRAAGHRADDDRGRLCRRCALPGESAGYVNLVSRLPRELGGHRPPGGRRALAAGGGPAENGRPHRRTEHAPHIPDPQVPRPTYAVSPAAPVFRARSQLLPPACPRASSPSHGRTSRAIWNNVLATSVDAYGRHG